MRKLFLLMIIGMFISCNKDDDYNPNSDIVGTWKLIEVLSDPGDGSGTFVSVESEKSVVFQQDGTLAANGALCSTGLEANSTVTGTYSLSNSTIETPNCLTLTFELSDNVLIISIPCDEPCKTKYQRQ